jgi:hypothetical protein
LTIKDLRGLKKLKKEAKKESKKIGLFSSSESEVCSDDSSDSDISSSSNDVESSSDSEEESVQGSSYKKKKLVNKHKKSCKKSGIVQKSSDKIRYKQRYPHSQLRYEFVSHDISFQNLDLNLFVAGELEIISDPKTKGSEQTGRLALLKRIMYLNTSHDFKLLKSYYAAVLREIELGSKSWNDDFTYLELVLFNSNYSSSKSSLQQGAKPKKYPSSQYSKPFADTDSSPVWFCSAYQRNRCEQKHNHMIVVRGKMHMAQHICATCWIKDKVKLQHPESSSSCPHTLA